MGDTKPLASPRRDVSVASSPYRSTSPRKETRAETQPTDSGSVAPGDQPATRGRTGRIVTSLSPQRSRPGGSSVRASRTTSPSRPGGTLLVVGGATAGSMRTPEEVNGAWDSVAALGLPPHMRTLLEEAKVNAAALRTQRDRNAELLASLHAYREQVRRLEAKCTRLQATLEKCEVSAARALSEGQLLADLASKDAAVEELRKQVDIAVKAREADQRVRRRDAMLAVKADESAKADLEALKRSLESKDAETRAAHIACRETQRAFDAFQRKVRAEKAKAAESAAERAAAEAARIEAERIESEQQAAAKIAAEQAAREMAVAQAAAEAAAIEAAAKQAQLDAARRAQEEEQRTAAAIAAEKDRQRRMIFDAAAAAREAKAVREAFAFKDKRERQAAAAERRKQAAAAAKARSDAVLAGTFGVVGGATLPSPRKGTANAAVRQVPPPLLRATTATGAPSSRSPSPGTSRRAVAQPSDGASSAVSASTTASTMVSGVDGVRSSSAGDGTGGRKKRRSKRKHKHPLPPPPPKVWGTDFIAPCDWRI